jgi:Asp-tRNA(Asn)/Glu-tRNA(Gln) amidotransferase A subunit family amidase
VAIIAHKVNDARLVFNVCEAYDAHDSYARDTFPAERHVNAIGPQRTSFKFGIPPPEILEICSTQYRAQFNAAVRKLQTIGGEVSPIDWDPFRLAGDLLYDGTFVSERLASLPDDFLAKNRHHLHPVIVQLFDDVAARKSTAVQAYRDIQAKALYTRQTTSQFASADTPGVDVVVVPTTPQHPTIKAMLEDPIQLNSKLGSFTHFGNILDLCAVATPAGTYEDKTVTDEGDITVTLPFSITFLGARCTDAEVLRIAGQFAEDVS